MIILWISDSLDFIENHNGFKFAKVIDYSDSGESIFIGIIRVNDRKVGMCR